VQDLETVVDAAGLDRFPLLGISQGAPVAIRYAARHPERVSRLVVYGGYAQGRLFRSETEDRQRLHELDLELVRLGWGSDNAFFRQTFSSQFMPDAPREMWDAFNELQRLTTSPENAEQVIHVNAHIDVTEEATQVTCPALVLHARDDHRPPFSQGRLLASLLPDSRFVALETRNHILQADEPAWSAFVTELEAFLAEE
jgi:pimeloyl-ACP methyl ester carboxylesterase